MNRNFAMGPDGPASVLRVSGTRLGPLVRGQDSMMLSSGLVAVPSDNAGSSLPPARSPTRRWTVAEFAEQSTSGTIPLLSWTAQLVPGSKFIEFGPSVETFIQLLPSLDPYFETFFNGQLDLVTRDWTTARRAELKTSPQELYLEPASVRHWNGRDPLLEGQAIHPNVRLLRRLRTVVAAPTRFILKEEREE